jgi:perosamine synthetase
MTTGEGGMLVTDRTDLFERALVLRDHGRIPGDVSFFNQEVAFKYKMSSMQAALGLAQVERAEQLVEKKRCIFAWYAEALQGVAGLKLNPEPAGTRNSYWMVTAVLDASLGLTKEVLERRLAERGIATRPFFHPLSSIPAYASLQQAAVARRRNRIAYAICPFGINLPSALSLTREQVVQVCRELRAVIAESALDLQHPLPELGLSAKPVASQGAAELSG